MTAQYPLGAVKSPLPDFRIGPYKTESHALHDKSIRVRSDVLKRQFVTMRAVWPRCIPPSELGDTAKARYGLDRTWERAEQLVSKSDEFRKYLQISQLQIVG